MKKIIIIFGTRPEAIKMAPLVKKLKSEINFFEIIVCVTAQHREMLDQVLSLFNIQPEYDLNIMEKGQDLFDITSKVILGLREILKIENPDLVLVHGDTTTSFAAAIAAYYYQIPVGHIEAGLRTNNIYSPWPEEINRQLTGRIASYHFAPTELSKKNLLKENVKKDSIYVTGNTVIDALHLVVENFLTSKEIEDKILNNLILCKIDSELCKSWKKDKRKMVLITGHRRENFGDRFINICNAIKELAEQNPNVDFVYPMHLNPNVRKPIVEVFGENYSNSYPNIYLIEPQEYLQFVYLMYNSYLILTDSGGIQEEATGLGKPVFVMRETTERTEGVEAGIVKLIGLDKINIVDHINLALRNQESYRKYKQIKNPFGDGTSSEKITKILKNIL